ncbi:MAG TPA: alpha-E domain-containing protein [Verrucomicrobiales bacterium]|nr:alpha-E domain-containing protein [Verrucomicrobiales bacterium]
MLCRVADSLFWMSRYIERAENTARLTDVNVQLLLELEHYDEESTGAHWRAVLQSLGDHTLFDNLYPETDTPQVTEFLTFARHNPSSVLSCLLAARENARMIRDQISVEMWEIINRLYLFLREQDAAKVLRAGPSDFFQQIKEMSHLFRGMTDATFPRKIGYEFIKAGCYLERADKTGRIVDISHHLSLPDPSEESPPRLDAERVVRWITILRSCTAHEAYHRIYVGDVLPRHAAGFLVLSRDFPRSILFCLNQLQFSLHAISGCPLTHYSNEAERLCGKIIAEIVYSSVDDVTTNGLHELLSRVKHAVDSVGIELSKHYMFYPIVDPTGGNGGSPSTEQKQEQTSPG